MEIADQRVATVHFTLLDQQGGQITTTHGHDPLVYVHGAGGIVRGLEEALAGKKAGDSFEVEVPPEKGFGQRHDALVQTLPDLVASHEVHAPTLLIVGEVVTLREQLAWFRPEPSPARKPD